MSTNELLELVKAVSEVGIPVVVTLGVIYLSWKIGAIIPDSLKKYIETGVERDKRQEKLFTEQRAQYEEQLKRILTVAQQGLEAQRRGNEVIERNNIIMEAKTRMDEALIHTLNTLIEQSKRVEEVARDNRECVEKTYMEAVLLGERFK